ncbi:MAG: hypothetical protein IKG14_00955 [Clostridia bacterium]|nr:hypothetical protein [Clostridia bacterium]
MIVNYDNIKNGTNDIAKYLNLNPSKTIFLHSTSFNEADADNIRRKALNKGRMLYAEILSYTTNLSNGSKSAISYFNNDLLNLMDEMKVIDKSNIIKVINEAKIDYPYNSVSTMLNKKVKEDDGFRKLLEGFTIVSSYLSKEDEETARLINGSLLMDRKVQENFNSKYYFREISEKYGFAIPTGVTIKGLDEFNNKLNKLKSLSPTSNNLWIKLESQSSGTGNLKIENYYDTSVEEIKNKIYDIAKPIFDDNYINSEMALIAEVDINLDNYIEVANIGVEAVISENKVTILGGVEQDTNNGTYVGSKICDNTYKYLDFAQNIAKDAFVAVSKEGYRGFMTIDVLVTQNTETGELKGYNIDPNARFSAGTMLLKNVQTSEVYHNKKMYGISYAIGIPRKQDDLIKEIKECLGDCSYNYNGDYTGIIPALVNDLDPINNDLYYLKCVVVDQSYKLAKEKFEQFKMKFRDM